MTLSLLVIDSNTLEANAEALSLGLWATGPQFAHCLQALDTEIRVTIRNGYADNISDDDIASADGVVFTGSAVEWSVEAERAAPLRALMERVFDAKTPTYGSCNGAQLAAVVLGGRSQASPNGRELGFAKAIELTDTGSQHPMMAGRDTHYACPCVHRDEVTQLPKGASLLAANAHSNVQAFAYEHDGVSFWGTQYHPEYSAHDVGQLISARTQIFAGNEDIADQMLQADENPDAAQELGINPADLSPLMRQTELRNWLAYLKGQTS